jgi:hypothetical protein
MIGKIGDLKRPLKSRHPSPGGGIFLWQTFCVERNLNLKKFNFRQNFPIVNIRWAAFSGRVRGAPPEGENHGA